MSRHCDHCADGCMGDPAVQLDARMHRSPDGHAYWDAGFCPVCLLITKEQAKLEQMRAFAEAAMSKVTPEWLLEDAGKPRTYPICNECGQVIIRGER